MFFSEIGAIRATLCTIEACADKRQVIKHLDTIIKYLEKIADKLEGDQNESSNLLT